MKKLVLRLLCDIIIFSALVFTATQMRGTPAVAATAARETVTLPILMYHSVLKDPSRSGTYVVTPTQLESDFSYLKKHGYETVVMQDLIDYVAGTGDLPDKPVMITFDDGYYNNLVYVLPLLKEYDMRAVISVVGIYSERFTNTPDPNPNYGHLSFSEITQLVDSGYVEIQNHSYDMHSLDKRQGSDRLRGESDQAYQRIFCEDVSRTQSLLYQNCQLVPTTFTYPFGLIGKKSREYLQSMGFLATLTCYEKQNCIVRGETDCLFSLGRYNRPSRYTTEAFMKIALSL